MDMQEWICEARWQALCAADRPNPTGDDAWNGFDNLRSMIANAPSMPDWEVAEIEAAYVDAACAAFGRDYFR